MEMPCVAPAYSGRPYSHAYVIGSRFAGHSGWGPPQVPLQESKLSVLFNLRRQVCDVCMYSGKGEKHGKESAMPCIRTIF